MDPDQTAPEQSDLGPPVCKKRLLKSQADDKADYNCCHWQFKGLTVKYCLANVKFCSANVFLSYFRYIINYWSLNKLRIFR